MSKAFTVAPLYGLCIIFNNILYEKDQFVLITVGNTQMPPPFFLGRELKCYQMTNHLQLSIT